MESLANPKLSDAGLLFYRDSLTKRDDVFMVHSR